MRAKVRMRKGVSFCVRLTIGRVFINTYTSSLYVWERGESESATEKERLYGLL